jgi:hypothetical protein
MPTGMRVHLGTGPPPLRRRRAPPLLSSRTLFVVLYYSYPLVCAIRIINLVCVKTLSFDLLRKTSYVA